jgi:hypothetical protein
MFVIFVVIINEYKLGTVDRQNVQGGGSFENSNSLNKTSETMGILQLLVSKIKNRYKPTGVENLSREWGYACPI